MLFEKSRFSLASDLNNLRQEFILSELLFHSEQLDLVALDAKDGRALTFSLNKSVFTVFLKFLDVNQKQTNSKLSKNGIFGLGMW